MQVTRNFLFVFLLMTVLTMTQCKKDDEKTPNELIIGVWQVVEIGGDVVPADEVFTYEFEADQGLEICYTDETETYCYDGEWNWLGTDYDKLNVEYTDEDGYAYSVNLEVERLDESNLEMVYDGELAKFIKL